MDEFNLIPYKIKQNFHKKFEHLKNILIKVTDVSLLVGTDMPELHLPNEIRTGKKMNQLGLN